MTTASITRELHIEIKTIDGDEEPFKFKADTLVGKAKQIALEKFHIVPSPGVIYRLAEKKPDGQFRPLDDNKTLAQENIQNKTTLFLGTEGEVGYS